MLLKPGTLLMTALPYFGRQTLLIVLACGTLFLCFTPTIPTLFVALSVLLLLYFSLSVSQITKNRLQKLGQALEVKDQPSVIPLIHSDAEFNRLAHCINPLLRTLERHQQLLISCSQETRYTATELQNSSTHVAQGAEEEYLAIDTLAATSQEMNNKISTIAERIAQTSQLAANTKSQSEKGQDAQTQLKERLTLMQGKVDSNQSQMASLSETASNIRRFVETIETITSQINLLSLNAAIESARAGEAGRGFAVVANEVRTLAANTELATQDIATLVDSISKQVNACEQTSDELIAYANSANASAEETDNALQLIYQAAHETQDDISVSTQLISEFRLSNAAMSERLQSIALISKRHSKASQDTKDMVKYLEWLSSRLEQKELAE
ncbi:hypothetical protein GCM10009112_20800 [Marinomonas arenicola]|uniref:methyl-accepting chemotaxis protein n=1 Tax=Marinomonas TaxID=28253 RepID=UPI0010549C09|nr:methyl-accepting chemotaxis protein [Marinomonas sp. KMM3893]